MEGTTRRVPRGPIERTFSQEDNGFWGHDLKRLTAPDKGERRQEGDMQKAARRREDVGPILEKPRERRKETERRGEQRESDAGTERSRDLFHTEQINHVLGGTSLHKVRCYFKEGRAVLRRARGGRER
ncbi:hypothetical protein NDU88_002016 [Pleurodeles waltl]|uniref:Uncharacterized protein n=1 Tax=Pleurodeles waltl TaxID=8319 RepID=A0AAV7SAF1_PLEWA|nr:hypothetical protein NDU88_002016 [Pleurodeles waltl]